MCAGRCWLPARVAQWIERRSPIDKGSSDGRRFEPCGTKTQHMLARMNEIQQRVQKALAPPGLLIEGQHKGHTDTDTATEHGSTTRWRRLSIVGSNPSSGAGFLFLLLLL
eukprot:scaffold15242_cov138-Isochrysis_galbana.AAC.5